MGRYLPAPFPCSSILIVVLCFILFLNWNCSANNLNGICINWAQSCQSCDWVHRVHIAEAELDAALAGNGQARKLNRFCVQDKSLVNWITLVRNPFTGNYPTACATPTLPYSFSLCLSLRLNWISRICAFIQFGQFSIIITTTRSEESPNHHKSCHKIPRKARPKSDWLIARYPACKHVEVKTKEGKLYLSSHPFPVKTPCV